MYRTCFLLMAVFITSCTDRDVDTNCKTVSKPVDTYNYPVKPGDPVWTTYKNGAERLAALQIPQEVLHTISTEGLIQTCIDYPGLGNLALNVGVHVPHALQNMMTQFTGMIELTKRPDSGEKMLMRYSLMDPACILNYDPNLVNIGFSLDFSAFEMMICYDEITKNMHIETKKKLIIQALDKVNKKSQHPEHYAYYSFATSLYIPTKIMLQERYTPFLKEVDANPELELYIQQLLWPGTHEEAEAMFTAIINHANDFIKK